MLVFSHRGLEGRADGPVFGQKFTTGSVGRWKVLQMNADVDDADLMETLLPLLQESRPLLLYLHGYNSTPAACFERCDRLQSLYGLEVVRFSWSSKKYLHDEGGLPGLPARMDTELQRDLARLFGPRHGLPSNDCLGQFDPVACDLDSVTCSWWMLMALAGIRH